MKIIKSTKFLKQDENGFIINEANQSLISTKWKEAIDYTVLLFKELYKDKLDTIYLRGSVTIGAQIDTSSDIDILVFLRRDKTDDDYAIFEKINKEVIKNHPFIERVDIIADNVSTITTNKSYQVMIKTQSICIYGNDSFLYSLPSFTPKEAIFHIYKIGTDINNFIHFFNSEINDLELIKLKCKTIMKRIVRTGFELVVNDSGKYTRDLYTCYSEFVKYYPNKKQEMEQALLFAIEPTNNVDLILKVLKGIGRWISIKAKQYN